MNMANRDMQPERPSRSGPEQYQIIEGLKRFLVKLSAEADRRVKMRSAVETRWLEDIEQYHGRYNSATLRRLVEKKMSRVFLNLTRAKTNAMQARLWDLLFPTDDRNWAIQPTPVPEMDEDIEDKLSVQDDAQKGFKESQAKLAEAEARAAAGDPAAEEEAQALAAEMEGFEQISTEAEAAADALVEIQREAAERCRLMEQEIEDQLKACGYQAECRDVIRDACKVGTGILKGPVIGGKVSQRWAPKTVKGEDGVVTQVHELAEHESDRPSAHWVDFWSFFPSPDAARPEDSEGFYERHLMRPHQLRKLARRQDIDKDAVRRLIKVGPGSDLAPSYLVSLRNITEQQQSQTTDLFHVWEYTGVLDADDLKIIAEYRDDKDFRDELEELDPLDEMHVRIWFCQNELLSFSLHPLDSNEPIYSVFNMEDDESSMFGFGIPYIMRDEQSGLNAAKRMMMDNSGLTTGPQIVIDKERITPANGDWTMEPMKIWYKEEADDQNQGSPFDVHHIDGHQAELANIIELNRRDVDEVTSLPQIAQGEQGTNVTKTAQGMALLMNSANVGFRRFVKNFDDNLTVPMIRRFYDFNMQFSKKESIKGDYEVDARGSSVLLVREMQANNLMMIMSTFGNDPIYGPWLKHENLLKDTFRAHNIPAHEHIKTKREMEKDQQEAAQREDPAMALEMKKLELEDKKIEAGLKKLELEAEVTNAEWAAKREIAKLQYDADMEKFSLELNRKEDERAGREGIASAQIGDKAEAARISAEHKERSLAAEVAMARETGKSSGGAV